MTKRCIDPENTILFVGAGASVSLGVPSWNQLIDEIARQLSYDPRVFRLYGDYLSLAGYYSIKRGGIGPLLEGMDKQWHGEGVDIRSSQLHEAIVKARFRRIYTTNFDRYIEKACDEWGIKYRKILTVKDIAVVRESELEIIKLHGDFDDEKTMVLTEESYFRRLDFQSPLDLILRADALRYSILFIGYSMSDINVRYLFHKLSDLWKLVPDKAARPESFIFMMRPNPVAEAVFGAWGITPLPNEADSAEDGLREFLFALVRKS